MLTLLLLLLLQSGCSWFGAGEQERYLLEGSSKPVVIPANLDEPDFVDLMPIPEIDDYRGLGDVDLEVGLPDPLSTEYGVDKIVIRRLGDNRWVFADSSTSIIWPQVVSYWEENNLPVASLDPRNGVLETAWLPATGDDAESIFSSIREGAVLDDTAPGSQHKFRVRVEPG
ncbi:MAG: outer membrane protein assembly factor BamC, partial [Pseudomonadales bacterium]